VERPVTVRAGLGALIGSLVLYAVSQIVTFLNWDLFLAAMQAQASTAGTEDVPFDPEAFAEAGLRIGLAVTVVLGAAYLLFVWFAWKGHNWARIVLWVLSGLFLVVGLAGAVGGAASGIASPLPYVTALTWFEVLFLAVGIVLLALKPSSDWYRYRGWLRATGQPG
jgi:hypothetical protein